MFLKISEIAGPQAGNFIKKRLQQRCFPVKFEIFKNTYFEEHMRTAASKSLSNLTFNPDHKF